MAEPEVNYQQLAQQLLLAIRGIPQQIPGFIIIPPSERRRLVAQANVRVPFLNSAAAALDASQALVGATGLTGVVIRNAVMLRNAMQPVGEELIIVGQGVRDTITTHLAEAGKLAYQVYAISKTLNRTADREILIPHIEAMRRNLDRSRGPAEPQPDPQPQPQPEPNAGGGTKK